MEGISEVIWDSLSLSEMRKQRPRTVKSCPPFQDFSERENKIPGLLFPLNNVLVLNHTIYLNDGDCSYVRILPYLKNVAIINCSVERINTNTIYLSNRLSKIQPIAIYMHRTFRVKKFYAKPEKSMKYLCHFFPLVF